MTLRLSGDNSGFTEIKAADTAGDNSIKLPASNGSAYQLLHNGGTAGELQFASDYSINDANRLLIGHNVSTAVGGTGKRRIQVYGTNFDNSSISLLRSADNVGAPQLVLAKTRGSTVGSIDAVEDDDRLGEIYFAGSDGSDIAAYGAKIECTVDGTVGTNLMPGRLTFYTNPGTASASPQPRWDILPNGTLSARSGTPGIDFSGIQSAAANGTMSSETLDSYEEGTWTPAAGSNFGEFTNSVGHYTKVGRVVTLTFQFNYASGSASNTGQVTGLPFTVASHNPGTGIQSTNVVYTTAGGSALVFLNWAEEGHAQMNVHQGDPLAGTATSSAGFIRGSLSYMSD